MSKENILYRSIARGTALMGGVQFFNLLINIIRGKLVALFLGPFGIGMSSLFSSSISMVQQFSCLGLNLAIVKEIADKTNGEERIISISIIKTLLLITAIIGALLTICLSQWLSCWTFGNYNYKWHFVALAVVVLLSNLSNGYASILQGVHAMKRLAYSSLVGCSVGLFVGVPLYFFFNEEGIVPAMIALAFATYIFYKHHTYKELGHIAISTQLKGHKDLIKSLLSLGIISMISILIGNLTIYVTNIIIRGIGSLQDVGYYQAATSITSQFVSLVFSAMSVDYLPRLASVSHDNKLVTKTANLQAEIVILTIAPIVALMLLFAPILIRLLLTDEFIVLGPIVRIMGIGIFLKALCFPIGYISFAKGDKKTFFILEGIFGNLLSFSFNIWFYYLWGLTGLSIGFVLTYLLILFVYQIITKKLYSFKLSKTVIKLTLILGLLIGICYLTSLIQTDILSYSAMSFFVIVISTFSIYELNKRLDLYNMLINKFMNVKQNIYVND